MLAPRVHTGLDVLVRDGFAPLRGLRVGLVANAAVGGRRLRHAAELDRGRRPRPARRALRPRARVRAARLRTSSASADVLHPRYRCPVLSLYGDTVESCGRRPTCSAGWTCWSSTCRTSAAGITRSRRRCCTAWRRPPAAGLPVVVLDRPNPIGGVTVEGPTIQPGYESFVGPHPIPTRHGLTLGELARLYASERQIERGPARGPVRGLAAGHGLRRDRSCRGCCRRRTCRRWTRRSSTPASAWSRGRTCRRAAARRGRSSCAAAPWVDAGRVAARLAASDLPGVAFRPASFRPTFHKFAGQTCGGVQLHVTDRGAFRPVRTGLAVLAALRRRRLGARSRWRTERVRVRGGPTRPSTCCSAATASGWPGRPGCRSSKSPDGGPRTRLRSRPAASRHLLY